MIIKNINKIKEKKYRDKKIISFDYGTKRIGVAISNEEQNVAIPLINYQREEIEQDIEFLVQIIRKQEAEIIVIGLALDLEGKYNKSAHQAKSFANLLRQATETDIFFFDERYSSVQAAKYNIENKRKNKKEDRIAASVILESFLEFARRN